VFVEKLLAFDPKLRVSTAHGGILGHTRAYLGCVEAQDRGSLHVHLLIWVRGFDVSPTVLLERLRGAGLAPAPAPFNFDAMEDAELDAVHEAAGLADEEFAVRRAARLADGCDSEGGSVPPAPALSHGAPAADAEQAFIRWNRSICSAQFALDCSDKHIDCPAKNCPVSDGL
jgi:hypothetical protein